MAPPDPRSPLVEAHDIPDLGAQRSALDAVLAREGQDLIPLMQAIQRQFGFLPRNVLALVSAETGIPLARFYGVATFYSSFFLQPRGRRVLRVCRGTACHVRGAQRIIDELARRLGIEPGGTTDDMELTLESVACLGCCSLAPVMTVDGEIHARLDQQQALALASASPGGDADS
jgi:NADH-quinone oxidoreductase subunit E